MLRRSLTCIVLLVVGSAIAVFAQGALSEINGSAVDQSGAVLPGVSVTLTEESTGIVRTVVSNETGRWVAPAIQPGRYTVSAELAGFQSQRRTGVTLNVGQAITINLTLPVGTLQDQVTVTGEAPLIEVTQNVIGTNVTRDAMEDLPTAGRQQYALLQLVPGLTPTLAPGAFEGGQYSSGGRSNQSNLFLVDGAYNIDDRTQSGSGSQTRMTMDTTAEYQVLVHEFGAEYGGVTGLVVNAITRGGTNEFHGRGAYYLQDSSLDSTNYFLKLAGAKPAESGVKTLLGNVGGPIIRDKAFFFFNAERLRIRQAADLLYPPEAAPLAVLDSTFLPVDSENYFTRVDYQINPSNNLSFRAIFDVNRVDGQSHVAERRTLSALRVERVAKPGETFLNGQWLRVMGNRLVNELRLLRVTEVINSGDARLFGGPTGNSIMDNDSKEFPGLQGIDQLDFGSGQLHPDYLTGVHDSPSSSVAVTTGFTNQLTFTPTNHTLKMGGGASNNSGSTTSGNQYFGQFGFAGNRPFDPADAFTYPNRYQIRLGELFYIMRDWRYNWFVSDKWRVAEKLTLTLGLRYDYQDAVPQTKDGFQPRVGMAYAPSERTVIRAGFGKTYQWQSTRARSNLQQGAITSPQFAFDTGQDNNPVSGRLPTRNACLLPNGSNGLAVISAACRAQLVALRDSVAAGGFINTEPILDGNRKLGNTWTFNTGIQHELFPGVAVSADYVGNRGRNQTAAVDINEPRLLANGTIGRPGPAGFDPDGTLIPASARTAAFQRVLLYTTSSAFNSDYNALELTLNRRQANRWSGRLSYTLSRARDVVVNFEGRIVDDLNPRSDLGLSNFHNRHSFTAGGNWDAWRGLAAGFTFRYYSGNPVNETVGLDANGDRDNTDRPVKGVHDLTRPIESPVDANGVAVRNGIPGNNKMLLDLRLQYMVNLGSEQHTAGFFWEVYNAANRVNFGNPIGNRNSSQFLESVLADTARSMQLGFRYTF